MRTNLLERALEMEEEKDSIQVGSSSERIKVYVNMDDPQKAKRKVENALGLREYVRSLEEEDSEEARRELMEEMLERASKEEGQGEVSTATRSEKAKKMEDKR